MNNQETILKVEHLKQYFKDGNKYFKAVDDISFEIKKGEVFGLVGESGCGKTTTGRSIIKLYTPTGGNVYFKGEKISAGLMGLDKEARKEAIAVNKKHRAVTDIQMIFQDPMASLNPRMTVREIIAEGLIIQGVNDKKVIDEQVYNILETVGLVREHAERYPHEFSGGQRQRIGIARAIIMNPSLIIADEPISALDVSIQAQVINLLNELREKMHLTILFIAHDLSVVKYISDDIMVMYLGQLVEKAPADALFEKPMHPYTKALLSAIPIPDIHNKSKRIIMQGEITSPINPKPGCRFKDRCPYASDACSAPQVIEEVEPGHFVSCSKCAEINK